MKGITKCCYILNIKALGLVVSEKRIFSYFSHYKPMLENDAPGAWQIWGPGTRVAGFMKGLLNIDTHKIFKLWVSWFQKRRLFYVFPIITLWELSVAMDTRVPIRSGQNPNAAFPPPQ